MLLNARQTAYLGVLLAICEVLLYLSSVLSINTLALLFLAACCVGIACMITNAAKGGIFLAATLILGYLILPDKLYLVTFAGLGIYVEILEGLQPKLLLKYPAWVIWLIKFFFFNMIYIPILIFAPRLVYSGDMPGWIWPMLILAGNGCIVVFDYLYLGLERKYAARIQALLQRR